MYSDIHFLHFPQRNCETSKTPIIIHYKRLKKEKEEDERMRTLFAPASND
jgi:hypothetical protein